MAYKHTITPRDKWFLDKHMKDPATQEPFKVGDTIVICAKCKTAHYDSSWSLNANKCCSMGCNHSCQMNFNKFSPAIFQPKSSRNAQFKVIVEKLSFAEKLKLLSWYPMANVISALIPILVFVFMVCVTQYQMVPTFSTTNLFEASHDKLVDVTTNSFTRFENIAKNSETFDIDLGEINYELTLISSSFDRVEDKIKTKKINDKLKSTRISDKLISARDNIGKIIKNARIKLTQFFDFVSKFFNKLFEQ